MTRVGTSTDPIRPTDVDSPPNSSRNERIRAPNTPSGGTHERRRSLSAPLEGLGSLRSTHPGSRSPVAPPAPSLLTAPPDAGDWTRLLAGEGIDEERTPQRAASVRSAD